MTSDLVLLATAITIPALLELVARYAGGALGIWARGVVTWSGVMWTALAVLMLGSLLLTPESTESENPGLAFIRLTLVSLCVGGSFYTGGFLAESAGRRLHWRPWATETLALVTTVPSVLAGYTLYAFLLWLVKDQQPYWHSTGIANMFDSITLWLCSMGAVFVGLVRLLYNVRFHAIEAERARLTAETTAARLAHLEDRLRPHFLYNALSGLAGLIHEHPDRAETMTLALARLLQRSLNGANDAPTLPLQDEVALARDYLAVEEARFGDRLNVTIEVEGDVLGAEVPRLTLQPLVENAIKHGLGKTDRPVVIVVTVAPSGPRLHLVVADDGPPFPPDLTGGHGLTSVTERLRLLYDDQFDLHFDNGDGRGRMKHVRVSLPFTLAS